ESPALRIIDVLAQRGAVISYHDPFVTALPELDLESSPLDELLDADAIVLVTAHAGIDYGAIAQSARLFVDLRGKTRGARVDDLVRL
ncbi:MAG: UDP binding domain-containing protein, partial [Solirubrobacteraceae bacterium]